MGKLKEKAVSGIMLTLLLMSMLSVAFGVKSKATDPVITHVGDLIIDGNETFFIENCTYIQTGNIYVRDNATLILQNAELFLEQSDSYQYNLRVQNNARLFSTNANISSNYYFDQSFSDDSMVNFTDTHWKHFTWTYGDGASLTICKSSGLGYMSITTSMFFYNSSAEFILNKKYSSVLVENSSMSFISIEVDSSELTIANLKGGYISSFNTFDNLTVLGGSASNLTVLNSNLNFHFQIYGSNVNVNDCDIDGIEVESSSGVYINNSTLVWGMHLHGMSNTTINHSIIGYIDCGYGNTNVSVYDSLVGVYTPGVYEGFASFFIESTDNTRVVLSKTALGLGIYSSDFKGILIMDDVIVRKDEYYNDARGRATYLTKSHFYLCGNVRFEDSSIGYFTNSEVTRNFNVIVMNETSNPLVDVELKLYDRHNNVVWSGLSNSHGKVNFNLTFTDSNYTETLRLEAVKGTSFSAKNVTFLSETPVIMVLSPPFDTTPPTTPVVTDDGEYTSSTTSLHATWSSSDPESGIAEYQYAIGTSPGDTDVVDWTSAGTATGITHTGLDLLISSTYYFSVKARNGKGLWSAVGASDGITVTTITFDLSPGWESKELFVPILRRSREEPGAMMLGALNRRDMWYLVKIYKKMPDKTWMEIIPDEFLKGLGPYLGPWSERAFLYTSQMGNEIKIQVWNDMNDATLMALWGLDFVTRALTGVRIPPKLLEVDWQTLKSKLNDFYNDVVKPVKDQLLSKAWKSALIEICKAILKAPQLYSSILIDLGFEPSVAAGIIVKIGKFVEGALRLFAFFVNIPTWKDLLENLNKEPFMEDVIFTAKYKVPPAIPDIRVTESLTILQKEPYYVGQTIDAQFTVINKGTAPMTFNVLTVGGRGPQGEADVRDFTFRTDITLNPGGSYNYEGEVKLLDNGTWHFFIAYQTPDGNWEASVPTEAGITNTVDIFVNPIPEKWLAAELGSPGELRVYDSQGRVTGLVNGEEKNEIPYSAYYDNIVVILAPTDSCNYDVVGTGDGSYSLMIINGTVQEIATFNATDIPTSANGIHRYTVDWAALARGEKGVTIRIDSNGDGVFEKTFTSDNELTRDEFMYQVRPVEAFPMWILGVAVVAIAIATASTVVFWRKRKHPPTK